MTKQTDIDKQGGRDRPAALSQGEIEITPAMVEAGVYAAREHCIGAPLADLVRTVYVAMVTEGRSTS